MCYLEFDFLLNLSFNLKFKDTFEIIFLNNFNAFIEFNVRYKMIYCVDE